MLAFVAGAQASAHRKDELLQAARLGIALDRVRIDLDLTPGIAVADAVLADIDADRNGSVSRDEGLRYASRVLSEIRLDVDGRPLDLRMGDSEFPPVDDVRRGEGTIRMALTAPTGTLDGGVHTLHYRNAHRPDIGVYLANALVPATDRIAITSQDRDAEQRGLSVGFEVRSEPVLHVSRWAAAGGVAVLLALVLACHRYWLAYRS